MNPNRRALAALFLCIFSTISFYFTSLTEDYLMDILCNYVAILGYVIAIVLFRSKNVSKVLGLQNFKKHFSKYWIGTLSAILLSFLIGAILYASGRVVFTEYLVNNWVYLPLIMIVFMIQSLAEEILFRAFLFDFIRKRIGGVFAIFITSILFSLLHSQNAYFNWLPFINIFLFALFANVVTYKHHNIYYASGFHFGWNFIQVVLLGVISGIPIQGALFHVTIQDDLLGGGAFGFEASIITTFLFILCFILATQLRSKRPTFSWMFTHLLAHRGYFNDANPENSIGAFQAAIDHNFAIELDVHLSLDGEIVVFHDSTLKRMCGIDRKVKDLTKAELTSTHLKNTKWTIPTFQEVLHLIDGKVPIIVELKNTKLPGGLERAVYQMLKGYHGEFCVQSFNPFSVMWFTENAPEFVRGQLSSKHEDKASAKSFTRYLLRNLYLNFLAQVDFMNIDIHYDNARIRRLHKHIPKIGYTANTKEIYLKKLQDYDNVIFDNFLVDETTKHFVLQNLKKGIK